MEDVLDEIAGGRRQRAAELGAFYFGDERIEGLHKLVTELGDIDELAAMPKGRAVVLASGARPTLIRTQPWMTGPHAADVEASIRAHDPQADSTLTDAVDELHHVEQEEAHRERSTR